MVMGVWQAWPRQMARGWGYWEFPVTVQGVVAVCSRFRHVRTSCESVFLCRPVMSGSANFSVVGIITLAISPFGSADGVSVGSAWLASRHATTFANVKILSA